LKTVRQIIRESVRNMTVPATKGARDKSPGKPRGGEGMARTLSAKKRSSSSRQRHSAGHFDAGPTYENASDASFRTRSRTVADGMDDLRAHSPVNMDSSEKSDKSDRSDKSHDSGKLKPGRGLSLSTTSSLSNSSGSAKLIQSSNPPSSYHPPQTGVQASSPIWKPRENSFDKAATLPAAYKGKEQEGGKQYFVYDEYGAPLYVIPPTLPNKKEQPTTMSSKQSDC
jgi:T-lymphoma invasion and metastasis-inducing protein 1